MDLQGQDIYGVNGGISGDVIPDFSFIDDITTTRVNTCGGSVFCPRGKQDTLGLGLILEEVLHKIYIPGRLYIAVSGCDNQCAEKSIKDVGVIGTADGWDIYVGGDFRKRIIAAQLVKGLSTQEVIAIIERIVAFYRVENDDKKRLWTLIEGIGLESFKAKVLKQAKPGDS